MRFTARLIALRREYPLLRSNNFLHGGATSDDVDDLEWWDERGQSLSDDDWNNPEGRALVMRRARRLEDGGVEAVTLLLNASGDMLTFHLPAPDVARRVLIDSARPDDAPFEIGSSYDVSPHGAVLLRWVDEPTGTEQDAG